MSALNAMAPPGASNGFNARMAASIAANLDFRDTPKCRRFGLKIGRKKWGFLHPLPFKKSC
jgi:hypothetical protein